MSGRETQIQTVPAGIGGNGTTVDPITVTALVLEHLLSTSTVFGGLTPGGRLPDPEAIETLARSTRSALEVNAEFARSVDLVARCSPREQFVPPIGADPRCARHGRLRSDQTRSCSGVECLGWSRGN
jgi:hypothetical protein